ncbi:MAG: peptidyl-prolyl cis-trans isomerase [Lachnospiraceae bacterium]|nr:peptidyl-prolyl cis-trans isomerase [Lachnospiraceae bacterium]
MQKRVWMMVLCIWCVVLLMACGKKETEEDVQVVYRFGGAEVTYGEFYIYAKTVEEDYQKAYGNGIWSLELTTTDGKSTVRDVTRQDIVANMNRVKVLAAQAEDMNLSLGEAERAEAEDTATAFYNGLTEADLAETEITRELVTQVIEDNMLAKKVYDRILSEYDFEISEEEARMTTFFDMVFECYSVKKDGTVEEYTEEKKATQLQRANEALSSLAQDEDVSYESIVEKYHLEYADTYTMSRTELVESYGEDVAELILNLQDGEVSTVIQSQYGYHIFKMIQAKDDELTKKNKEEIIAAKQKEYFNGVYEEWLKHYDSHFNADTDVNQELINRFPFSENE